MYAKVSAVSNVFSSFEFHKENLICIIGNGTKANLTFFDKNLKIKEQLNQTSYDFFVFKNSVFFTTQVIKTDGEENILKSYLFNIENKKFSELTYTLHIKGIQYNHKYLCKGTYGLATNDSDIYYFLVDLNSFRIQKEFIAPKDFKRIEILSQNYILFSNRIKGLIGLHKNSGDEIWRKELLQEIVYLDWDGKQKKDKINCVKSWKNNLIVLTRCFLLCIDFQGNLMYKVRFPDLLRATNIVIKENTGYIYNYHDYIVIDLTIGKIKFHKEISSFTYENENYNNFSQGLMYHQGLLYHSVYSSGKSFVVAINAVNGETLWLEYISNQKINSMKFNNNDLYILDGENKLHILRKIE